MDKRRMIILLCALLCGLPLARMARAGMPSASYTINWDVIGGGGGPTMSGYGYTVDSTLGQTAIGWSENDHQLGSGFWYGVKVEYKVYLPIVVKNYTW